MTKAGRARRPGAETKAAHPQACYNRQTDIPYIQPALSPQGDTKKVESNPMQITATFHKNKNLQAKEGGGGGGKLSNGTACGCAGAAGYSPPLPFPPV